MSHRRVMPIQAQWNKVKLKWVYPKAIPWTMIQNCEARAASNHGGQSLERLAERGGLSACEALAVLDDRSWKEMDVDSAVSELERRIEEFNRQIRSMTEFPGEIVPGESVRDNMFRTGEKDPLRSWIRLRGGHCSGGGGPC